MKKILSQFHESLRACGLRAGARVVLAVSGGADSMALLRLFTLARKPLRLELCVAHLDHGLRRASAMDARFVERAAAKEQIAYRSAKADIRREAARRKLSIEEAAREIRYAFLADAAKKFRADAVVTAHTMDDQAETVLMRLLRGAGLRGLGGIPAGREARGARIVRPLLRFRKAELVGFLRADRTRWREDASNASSDYFRNKIRHSLLPHIKKNYSPAFDAHLVKLSEISREAQAFIEEKASADFRRIAKKSSKSVSLGVATLQKLHPAVRGEVLFLALESACASRRQFTKNHIDAIQSLLECESDAVSANLPRNLKVIKKGQRLIFLT